MKKKTGMLYIVAITLVISMLGSLVTPRPVHAAETVLSIDWYRTALSGTGLTDVCQGAEVIVAVNVSDVQNLYGYSLTLLFDPDAITVVDVFNAGWLSEDFPLQDSFDNATGVIKYDMTQMDPSLPVSGPGTLIYISLIVEDTTRALDFTINTTRDIANNLYPTLLSDNNGDAISYTVGDTSGPVGHDCAVLVPVNSKVSTCMATTVQVAIEDVVDLYAYQLEISYDPTIIELTGTTPITDGDIMSCPLCYSDFDYSTPGHISYYITQMGTTPSQSGDGILLNINFLGKIENQDSQFRIDDVILSDRDGFIIGGTLTNRTIWTYPCDPNAVDLLYFDVLRKKVRAYLTWETANELDNAGFNIYRSGRLDGRKKLINPEFIPAQAAGTTMGALYEYKDKPLIPWKTYYYWLEWIDFEGNATLSDPVKAEPPLKK